MESKKINQLATELAPELSDLTIIGDPTTGISKKITLSQMASLFTGTVEEYPNLASFPLVGTADTIYIALDTNIIYRWNTGTSAYVELSPNIVTSLVFNDANGFDGTISLVGSTATLTITTALTQGSIGFIGSSGALTQDNSNFFWDNTNKRLGINTNAPTTAIDAFGSGIIGRLNGTSTNNAFLGFASAGSNKWSIGNVQSDHRFRIYNETNTTELVSILQTGEFGIGIANPLTKLHIFGGATALIANLDANTSVAKSISFRSGNSSRINLEVSGTESGSNAGADFFIRRYSDAGALIDTPLTITRSTGYSRFANKLFVSSAGNAPSFVWSGINDFAVTNNVFASQALITNNSTLGNYSTYSIGKTRGTLASPTAVANGEIVGNVLFFGHDGTNYISGNEIVATVDGTVSSGIVPLSMTFRTRNASGTMADRLVLSANGNFGVGSAANERFGVTGTGGTTGFVRFTDGATAGLFFGVNSGTPFIHSNNSILSFGASGSNTFSATMTLSSGNIGIGNTPNAWDSIFRALQIGNFGSFIAGRADSQEQLFLGTNAYYGASGWVRQNSTFAARYYMAGGAHNFDTAASNNAGTSIGWDAKVIITNDGDLTMPQARSISINLDSTSFGGSAKYWRLNSNAANGTFRVQQITNGGGMYLDPNNPSGGWIGISDMRLKNDLGFIEEGALGKIMNLKPRRFTFKTQEENSLPSVGFFAQEIMEYLPETITEIQEEDGEVLTYNANFVIPYLVKAIQELKTELDELKAK